MNTDQRYSSEELGKVGLLELKFAVGLKLI